MWSFFGFGQNQPSTDEPGAGQSNNPAMSDANPDTGVIVE